jgi:multiple sugar transport system substrate-binding protein
MTGFTRRRLTAGITASSVPVLLAACAFGAAPAGSVAGVPTPGVRAGVTLTVAQSGNQTNADARNEIHKAFAAANPQIKPELLFVTTNLQEKIQSLISAGTPPDLFNAGNGAEVTSYIVRGALQDLTPFSKRDKFDTSDTFESALALYQFCGKQYAYPLDFANQELFYNVEQLEQAGVKLPPNNWNDDTWTFDRFLDMTRRLTKPDGGAGAQWGYLTGTAFRSWSVWVSAAGGDLFDKDLKTCVLNEPAAVEGLQFLQDLAHRHRVMPTPAEAAPLGGQIPALTNGRVASITLQPALGQVRRDMKQRWDVAPHPKGNSAKGRKACAGGGTGLGMASPAVGAKNLNEAWELLKFSQSRPQVETWIRGVGTVPPSRAVANSPVFADPSQPPKSIKIFTDGHTFLRPDPSIVRWTDITRVMDAELKTLWDGSQNARTVADNIKRGVDPILKEIQASGEMTCK